MSYSAMEPKNAYDTDEDPEELLANGAEEVGHEGYDEVDLPDSVYGAAIFGIAHDISEVLSAKAFDDIPNNLNAFRCIFSLALLAMNYVIQGFLLISTEEYVVLPAVHGIQQLYHNYHTNAFDATGTFSTENWSNPAVFSLGTKKQLCQIPLTNPKFTFVVILVWCMILVAELRETWRIFREVQRVEKAKSLAEVVEVNSGGPNHIRRLTTAQRLAIHAFITVPKLVLNGILFVYGTRWLVATPDFAGLILNSVALGFIVDIDELIYNTFLPKTLHANVESTKLLAPERSEAENDARHWASYIQSVGFLVGALGICFSYVNYSHLVDPSVVPIGVLPGYKWDLRTHCDAVVDEMSNNLCRNQPDPMQCFPYGGVNSGAAAAAAGEPSAASGHGGKR